MLQPFPARTPRAFFQQGRLVPLRGRFPPQALLSMPVPVMDIGQVIVHMFLGG